LFVIEEKKMTNKKSFGGMLVMALAFGLVLSGCATNVATTKGTNFDRKPMGLIGSPKYTVLGTVILEKNWFGVLGFTTPAMGPVSGNDFYLYQSGGITYVDLLAEAQKKYSNADAVIDIKVDYSGSHYWIFYGARKNIISGIAIKYSREEVVNHPQNEIYIVGEKK
jgi:hypothetical protein